MMSVQRVLSILDLYTMENRKWTIDDMAKQLKIPKSSLYRHVRVLLNNELLIEAEGEYHLGYKFLNFASIVKADINLTNITHPYMNDLTRNFGETSILSVLSNKNVVCLDTVTPSSSVVQVSSEEGAILPLYAGGSSKAIFAFQDDEYVNDFLSGATLEKFSDNTFIQTDDIWEEIARIRELGYSTSDSERDEGVLSIGYPIRNAHGEVFASLALAGPSGRFSKLTEAEVVNELKKAVQEIEGIYN